jgi:tetratricopeptide (TPR) repeat protein
MFRAKERNRSEAILDFGRTIAINPNYAEAYIQRGQLYQHDGKIELAFADYDAAVKADPNSARAYTKRGEIWLSREPAGGHFDDAITDLEQAVKVNPNDPLAKQQLEATKGLKQFFLKVQAEKK